MPNFFEKTSISPSLFVDVTSRYRNSTVVYYGEEKLLTFTTYKRTPITISPQDKFTVITSTTEMRPDLVSYQIYGFSHYWWKIMEYNNIYDIEDFKQGVTLRLPELV